MSRPRQQRRRATPERRALDNARPYKRERTKRWLLRRYGPDPERQLYAEAVYDLAAVGIDALVVEDNVYDLSALDRGAQAT